MIYLYIYGIYKKYIQPLNFITNFSLNLSENMQIIYNIRIYIEAINKNKKKEKKIKEQFIKKIYKGYLYRNLVTISFIYIYEII